MSKYKYGGACKPKTFSGTAGVLVSGNPTVRYSGFNVVSDTSAGGGIIIVKDAASGTIIDYETASAVGVNKQFVVPVLCDNLYLSAASGSLTAFNVTIFHTPE